MWEQTFEGEFPWLIAAIITVVAGIVWYCRNNSKLNIESVKSSTDHSTENAGQFLKKVSVWLRDDETSQLIDMARNEGVNLPANLHSLWRLYTRVPQERIVIRKILLRVFVAELEDTIKIYNKSHHYSLGVGEYIVLMFRPTRKLIKLSWILAAVMFLPMLAMLLPILVDDFTKEMVSLLVDWCINAANVIGKASVCVAVLSVISTMPFVAAEKLANNAELNRVASSAAVVNEPPSPPVKVNKPPNKKAKRKHKR
jgi:hypothetical protein